MKKCMRIQILTTIFSFLVLTVSYGQEDYDWTDLDFKGNVKSVAYFEGQDKYEFSNFKKAKKKRFEEEKDTSRLIVFNIAGELIEVSSYYNNQVLERRRYDGQGRQIEYTDYMMNEVRVVYEYDSHDNVTKETYFKLNEEKFDLEAVVLYKMKYDEQGNLSYLEKFYEEELLGKINVESEYDAEGRLLKESFYLSDDPSGPRMIYTYNLRGFELLKETYETGDSLVERRTCKYLSDTLLIKEELFIPYQMGVINYDNEVGLQYKDVYKTSIYDYHENGKLSREDYFFASEGVEEYSSVEKYNDQGQTLEIIEYGEGEEFEQKIVYTYNADNLLIEEEVYNKSRRFVDERIKYIYGENNRLLGQKKYNSRGSIEEEVTYIYDEKGNWIRKYVEWSEGEEGELFERAIEYYD